ncbi:MAG: hypothetical protein AAGE86_07440 [Pseudomonadota bacterium]
MTDDRPITPDSPLGRMLAADTVPALPSDFADRVLAGTKDRPAPLPETRAKGGGLYRWRSARRLAIGTVIAGALATTAAATGVFGDLPITIPSAEKVWATITGQEQEPVSVMPAGRDEAAAPVSETEAPVTIEGPINSPEELEEAFRRVDEVRTKRTENRRNRVDNRIDRVIENRREQGLRVPTPEQEERLRDRLDRFRERRDEAAGERLEERREELRQRVDDGEELSRDEFIREQREAVQPPRMRERIDRLRELPPEERRERIRQFRERRQLRREQRFEESGDPAVDSEPSETLPVEPEAAQPPTAPDNEDQIN